VEVFQGESYLPEENLRIGELMIHGLSKVPAGNEIVIQFRIDLSGLLTTTATEKRTGLAKSVTIDTAGQHRLNLDTARDNLVALFEEHAPDGPQLVILDHAGEDEEPVGTAPEQNPTSLLAAAKSLRGRAVQLLERGVAVPDATAIRDALAEITPVIESRDWAALDDRLGTLSDLLFYLED
jgi:molecular chaperone DnaK